MATLSAFRSELKSLASPQRAEHLSRFFKTGKGEYAEGDRFLGISVPAQRSLVKKYSALSLANLEKSLNSRWHEERLTSLLILVDKFKTGNEQQQSAIFELYLRNTKQINNWDLVDSSAPYIVGAFLADRNKDQLIRLAHSDVLWERRIAILATFCYIKKGDAAFALQIAEILLSDRHDLIHKAVGWMLREVGKRCAPDIEISFLKKHHKKMPRTMLRYAIERFEQTERRAWLSK